MDVALRFASSDTSHTSLPHFDPDQRITDAYKTERHQITTEKYNPEEKAALEVGAAEDGRAEGEGAGVAGVGVHVVGVGDGPGKLDGHRDKPHQTYDDDSSPGSDEHLLWVENGKIPERKKRTLYNTDYIQVASNGSK